MLREYAEPPSRDELEGRPLFLNYTIRPSSEFQRVAERITEDLRRAPNHELLLEDVVVEVERDDNQPVQTFGPTSLDHALHTIQRDVESMQGIAIRDKREHELSVRLAGLSTEEEVQEEATPPKPIATLVFTHTPN